MNLLDRTCEQHVQVRVHGCSKRIRTLVVDDSPLSIRTICSFLETEETIEVVGTAQGGHQALEQVDALRPDLVLLDFHMPGMNGLEVTDRLVQVSPGTRIVIVTGDDRREVRRAFQAHGAHGFVSKGRIYRELAVTIRDVFALPVPTAA